MYELQFFYKNYWQFEIKNIYWAGKLFDNLITGAIKKSCIQQISILHKISIDV